jgi:hypothetical protein
MSRVNLFGTFFGRYKGIVIFDGIPPKELLKVALFKKKEVIGGKRIVLAVHSTRNAGYKTLRAFMCYALQAPDGSLPYFVKESKGSYYVTEPWGDIEVLDRQHLETERTFLVGCSICGGLDIYRFGILKACMKHKSVVMQRLEAYKHNLNIKSASISERKNEFDKNQRAKTQLSSMHLNHGRK